MAGLVFFAAVTVGYAGDDCGSCAKPAAAPTTAPAAVPATMPTSAPVVLAVVDGKEITNVQINNIMSRFKDMPEEVRPQVTQRILSGLVAQTAVHKFLTIQNIACTDADVANVKQKELGEMAAEAKMTVDQFMAARGISDDQLRDQVKMQKLLETTTSADKVQAFITANPDYFNGTKVRASHVLIQCGPLTDTAKQLAAKAKLEQIAGDIKAGKITFEDAAKNNSDCPSKEKGGDLDSFTFERMVPTFAITAFGMKVGEVSPVVRTEFGFHLIKVTGREAPEASTQPTSLPAGVEPKDVATKALQSALEGKIMEMTLVECPIIIK